VKLHRWSWSINGPQFNEGMVWLCAIWWPPELCRPPFGGLAVKGTRRPPFENGSPGTSGANRRQNALGVFTQNPKAMVAPKFSLSSVYAGWNDKQSRRASCEWKTQHKCVRARRTNHWGRNKFDCIWSQNVAKVGIFQIKIYTWKLIRVVHYSGLEFLKCIGEKKENLAACFKISIERQRR
jgi:hypothetical protein